MSDTCITYLIQDVIYVLNKLSSDSFCLGQTIAGLLFLTSSVFLEQLLRHLLKQKLPGSSTSAQAPQDKHGHKECLQSTTGF